MKLNYLYRQFNCEKIIIIQEFQKMKEQKSNLEIGTEKLKGSIERLTRKRFSDFIKIYWKSVNLGKKA